MEVSKVKAEVARLYGIWHQAMNAGDIDAAMSMYCEESTAIFPDGRIIQGKPVMRDAFNKEQSLQCNKSFLDHLEYFELMNDNTAVSGGYHIFLDDNDKPKMVTIDTIIWKKKDGKWYIERDMWIEKQLITSE